MAERKYMILDARIKNLAKLYPEFQVALDDFEKAHGAEWVDVALVLLDDLRFVQKPEKFLIGMEILNAKLTGNKDEIRRSMAKSAAMVRHAENHAMKHQVFTHLDQEFPSYRSMDQAAEAIAGKLVPVTFRTVREWVAEWKKKRSAGRP